MKGRQTKSDSGREGMLNLLSPTHCAWMVDVVRCSNNELELARYALSSAVTTILVLKSQHLFNPLQSEKHSNGPGNRESYLTGGIGKKELKSY